MVCYKHVWIHKKYSSHTALLHRDSLQVTESNHINNVMVVSESIDESKKTKGTHGVSNSAGMTSYMKSVRRLYLTPLVTFSPEWGIPSCSKIRIRPGMGSTSMKRAPKGMW